MPPLIKRTSRFTEATCDDEIVIMSLDTGEFFALSETAAAAWRLMDGNRDSQAVLRALSHLYAVEEAAIAADVHQLLAQLTRTGIIEQV